jgi:polyphosphate kinase 2 (PPK2 family)
VDFGTLLFKFWIHISKEEQLTRFTSRAGDKRRSWKLTDEDWRNREKWELYEDAVNEMLLKTSTMTAPWTIIEGNSKLYARIKILKTLVDGLSQGLAYDPFADRALWPGEKKGKKEKKDKKKKNNP